MKTQSALIVGASRGLGFAISHELLKRNWKVTATRRATSPGDLDRLSSEDSTQLHVESIDITRSEDLEALEKRLSAQRFDLLFVVAGVASANGMSETVGEVSPEEFVRLMVTNSLAPMKVVERLKGLVSVGGTIGIMSSGQGSLAGNIKGGNDVYRASKAALNMMMRSFAARDQDQHSLLLLAPGWIKTDMGSSSAPFTLEETISDIVDTLTGQAGKAGLQYLDRFGKTVAW